MKKSNHRNLISNKIKTGLHSFILLVILVVGNLSLAQTITIGSGTNYNTFPLGNSWGFERSGSIYTAAEVSLTGNVTRVSWYSNTANAKSRPTIRNCESYLKN